MGLSFAAQAHTPVRWYFNPRAPCGARPGYSQSGAIPYYFNPRAPCGARRTEGVPPDLKPIISIHAPLAGRDLLFRFHHDAGAISIHAPLAGRDLSRTPPVFGAQISIHAPLAGRDIEQLAMMCNCLKFQSTRPLRGATIPMPSSVLAPEISIHAPLAGRDSKFDEFLSANLRKSNKKRLAERGENAA